MTHSSHARRQDVIEARNYEMALHGLVSEQKERVALVSLSGDWELMKAEFATCQKIEKFREDLLTVGVDKTTTDNYLIDTLVRSRISDCSCTPDRFRPGEYCADCGTYRSDGDEF